MNTSSSVTRCSFCDKSQDDVRVIVKSPGECAICDACVFTALDVISDYKKPLYLRVAYAVFKAIASIGYRVTYAWTR